MIAVVETGGANIASVGHALSRLSRRWRLTRDAEEIREATHVVLPGVGAAGRSMERIRGAGLERALERLEQPVLGICLGMQLLFERSEENGTDMLAILPGTVRALRAAPGRPVPHMGWNAVRAGDSPLFEGLRGDAHHFYFAHSFAAPDGPWVRAACDYGCEIPACVQHRNFHGVQFHPERSGSDGARVLANFLEL